MCVVHRFGGVPGRCDALQRTAPHPPPPPHPPPSRKMDGTCPPPGPPSLARAGSAPQVDQEVGRGGRRGQGRGGEGRSTAAARSARPIRSSSFSSSFSSSSSSSSAWSPPAAPSGERVHPPLKEAHHLLLVRVAAAHPGALEAVAPPPRPLQHQLGMVLQKPPHHLGGSPSAARHMEGKPTPVIGRPDGSGTGLEKEPDHTRIGPVLEGVVQREAPEPIGCSRRLGMVGQEALDRVPTSS